MILEAINDQQEDSGAKGISNAWLTSDYHFEDWWTITSIYRMLRYLDIKPNTDEHYVESITSLAGATSDDIYFMNMINPAATTVIALANYRMDHSGQQVGERWSDIVFRRGQINVAVIMCPFLLFAT